VRVQFPEGFLWGAATAAHQVEGGNVRSDWWLAEQDGRLQFASGAACEQYTRYEADFDLAVELGHTAHRLSVEWARIEPEPGVFDEREIEHYIGVLKALKARGLTSFVTLHHFTNPQWFARRGGWVAGDASQLFERYVRRIAPELAPYVDFWLTINEPSTVPPAGYVTGFWPPFRKLALFSAARMIEQQAIAHKRAYAALHELVPDARVGYTTTFLCWRPRNERSRWQQFLARTASWVSNYWFSDRVGDATDFIGLQFYLTLAVGWRPYGVGNMAGAPRNDLGWDIVPSGFRDVVNAAWRRYGKPIYITENGLADAADSRRADYIRDHLVELRRAMTDGADVRGYLHWSLLDNFEWAYGYAPRFGLVEVDFDTQVRTPRPSARVYERIIRDNGFEVTP